MNMKKINVIMVAALAGLSLSLTGCSEEFLDQKPKGQYGPDLLLLRQGSDERHRATLQPGLV